MRTGKSFSLYRIAICSTVLFACSAREAAPPNLVLISVDSLRADRLGCYGAERPTSPAIDALAAQGALFEQAVAPTSWTLPAHVSLLTGLSTLVHRVNHPDRRIDPARSLLAERLREHGHRTAAFVSAPYLHRTYGFDRGFDVYENLQGVRGEQFPPDADTHTHSHADQTAELVVDRALSWLAEQPVGGSPWFAFVHLWDVHYDYLPSQAAVARFDPDYSGQLDARDFLSNPAIHADMPARDLEHLRVLYDAEIRTLDEQLERLFDALRAREASEKVVIALVSDHGDEFFEHGNKGHTRTLFEESVRIPWLLRAPGRVRAGMRVGQVVSLEDVAPTLLALVGAPPLPEATGRDLTPLLRGEALATEPALLFFAPFAALRGADWKLIVNAQSGASQYYDLKLDPGEQHPLTGPSDRLAALSRRMDEAKRYAEALPWHGTAEVELDEATRARLRELGYAE